MAPFARDGVVLQERDFEILVGLFECRVMTLAHITELYFDGKREAAKKRVQKLKGSGYVRERARRIGDPSVLHIGRKAFQALNEHGKLEGFSNIGAAALKRRAQVSDLTLRHELEVMDVRVAFFRAARAEPHLRITEFTTWPALYQFTAQYTRHENERRELLVKPDGFIRIREATTEGICEHMFFLEVDRSSEAQDVIVRKATCYMDFYRSGGMALRFGQHRENYRDYPFRVIMVFKNDERRNNAAERLLQNTLPILTQVWLTTFEEIQADPLGKIWLRPKDYLKATRETHYEPKITDHASSYRRQLEREHLVELRCSKAPLFLATT